MYIRRIINKDKKKKIAILLRSSNLMKGIEDVLLYNEIPYNIVAGVKFYNRKESKDILSYLRFLSKTKDSISFQRIMIEIKTLPNGTKSLAYYP